MRTDLTKFEKGTIGFKCLNKEKDGLSKFGVMLNDMNKEVFDDMTITCPCCGSPVKLDLINNNFKNSYMIISKWFSYMALCSNTACSYQYSAFLKKEFWEETQINKNKISHTMTFGLSVGTLSLPIDDTYILQDILILLKEAGYKKIQFGIRNVFNQLEKIYAKNKVYKIDPQKYAKHCYDLIYSLSSNIMTIIAYKNKNKECKYNNISMLSHVFYNILKITNSRNIDIEKQRASNYKLVSDTNNMYLSTNTIINKSIFEVIDFNKRDRNSVTLYGKSAIPLYYNTFNDIFYLIDSDRIIYNKNYNCDFKNTENKKYYISNICSYKKEEPCLEFTIKGRDCPNSYDIYCAERYISDKNDYEIPYVFLILAGLDVDLLKQ